MKPQMLFGAVMTIIGSFQQGYWRCSSGQTNSSICWFFSIKSYRNYGFIGYDMGIAATLSVILLLIYVFHKLAAKLFREKD